MKKLSSIALISASLLATIVSITPMTSPAAAQVAAPSTGNTTTPTTGNQGTGTTTTYERDSDNSGLWGLAGLVGLLGFLGRRKEEDRTTIRRDDASAYRDPNVR
jgi:MYXO-CTERM domain-containing protein